MTQIDQSALDRMLCQRFARSAPIEEALLQIGMGKRDLPTREECREWGAKLGVPDDVRAALPPPTGEVGLFVRVIEQGREANPPFDRVFITLRKDGTFGGDAFCMSSDQFDKTVVRLPDTSADALTALSTAPTPAPEAGMVLVPREPTEAMIVKGDEQIIESIQPSAFITNESTPAIECYRAMIAASQQEGT